MRKTQRMPKYQINKLNQLLQSGYFVPIKTLCDDIWGISAFQNNDNSIIVKKLEGRFLGGGICESYGYKVRLGQSEFWCKSFYYALRCVYGYMNKNNLLEV